MHDSAAKWSPIPDWNTARLDAPGLSVSVARRLELTEVSGNLASALNAIGLQSPMTGAFGLAQGDRYALRLGRTQALILSLMPLSIEPGWHSDGFAATSVSAGLQTFQLSGHRMRDLVARAVSVDIEGGSPSALVRFAGVTAMAYCWDHSDCLRVHVDRGLAPYLWQWMTSRLSAMENADYFPPKWLKSQRHES